MKNKRRMLSVSVGLGLCLFRIFQKLVQCINKGGKVYPTLRTGMFFTIELSSSFTVSTNILTTEVLHQTGSIFFMFS
jgi:hypothetical protein